MLTKIYMRRMPRLIGTYHKAGTVWMRDLFRRYAKKADFPYWDVQRGELADNIERGIYFQQHMAFDGSYFQHSFRGLRMIRDPRDIIISGAHYHAKSTEGWLHQPRDDMGGGTYQQRITALDQVADRYRFEMQHVGRETIMSMCQGGLSGEMREMLDRRFLSIRYEDLIMDYSGKAFLPAIKWLGLHRKTAIKAYQFVHIDNPEKGDNAHIRSGRVAQWRDKFDRKLAQEFADQFQGVLEELDYEPNSDWVRQL